MTPLASAQRVGPRRLRVVALRANGYGQGAARVLAGVDAIERAAEVPAGSPAELAARALVDVDALDAVEHPPAALSVDRLRIGEPPPHRRRGVGPEAGEVVGRERRGRADDVAPEADVGRAVERETVGAHHVLDVDAAIEQLVDLDVRVLVGLA